MKITEDTRGLSPLTVMLKHIHTHTNTQVQTKKHANSINTHPQNTLSAIYLFIFYTDAQPVALFSTVSLFQNILGLQKGAMEERMEDWDGGREGRGWGGSSRNKGEASICTPIVFPSL